MVAPTEKESLSHLDRTALEARILSQSALIKTLAFQERVYAKELRDARRKLREARVEIDRLTDDLDEARNEINRIGSILTEEHIKNSGGWGA